MVLLFVGFLINAHLSAADFTLKTAAKAPPKEISESLRTLLQTNAIQLAQGDKTALEFWLCEEVSLKSKPPSGTEALALIAETTLLGAFVVSDAALRDYKDNEVPKGTYTARFALQPKDGDHLGTAEFDSFLVLVDAQNDKERNGLNTFKGLTKASGKSTSSGHPIVISLRPAPGEGTIPRLTDPAAEHKGIRLKIPAKSGSGERSDLVFDLVVHGHGHIQ